MQKYKTKYQIDVEILNIVNFLHTVDITVIQAKNINVKKKKEFCFCSSSETNKLKIFKLQKRACRVILGYNVDNIHEGMKSLKIMSVYDRLYNLCIKLPPI